jgi:cytosine/adenosine deaminase-related metal-dependent hydrolase
MRPGLIFLLLVGAEACAQIAITNVTVVDVETGTLRANQTVVIEGQRIAAADDAARVRVPASARVISGKGKFLIPGLWDMHVHDFTSPRVPEIFVANGVTGVRDMFDKGPLSRAGPRVVRCGAVLDKVDTPEQGRQAVRQQIAEGVDFIKVYNGLPREVYFAIADECKRARIPFVGHTPDAVTTVEAAATGQRSIEHLDGVLLDCSSNSAWLRFSKRFIPDRVVLETFSPAVAARVFDAYVRYGTWHCPTLTIYRAAVLADRPDEAQKDPKLKLVPKEWVPKPFAPQHHDEALDRAVQKKMMDVTAMMYRAGGRLLAGTDTG